MSTPVRRRYPLVFRGAQLLSACPSQHMCSTIGSKSLRNRIHFLKCNLSHEIFFYRPFIYTQTTNLKNMFLYMQSQKRKATSKEIWIYCHSDVVKVVRAIRSIHSTHQDHGQKKLLCTSDIYFDFTNSRYAFQLFEENVNISNISLLIFFTGKFSTESDDLGVSFTFTILKWCQSLFEVAFRYLIITLKCLRN